MLRHCYVKCCDTYIVNATKVLNAGIATILLHRGQRYCYVECNADGYETATLKTVIHHYAMCLGTSTQNSYSWSAVANPISLDYEVAARSSSSTRRSSMLRCYNIFIFEFPISLKAIYFNKIGLI